MTLSRLSSLLLCFATSVTPLCMPRMQQGIVPRAVEVSTSPNNLPSFPSKVEPKLESTTPKADPTTTKAVPTQTPANIPNFLIGTQTGQGTFYSTGLSACGVVNKDTDFIAAVSHLLFDAFPGYDGINPNTNPLCGKQVSVSYQGKFVTVALTDRCEGCALTDLDFSPSAFDVLADPSVGRLDGITWHWLD